MSALRLAGWMALALGCSGCAETTSRGAAGPSVEVTTDVRPVSSGRVEVKLTQREATVTLAAARVCDLHRFRGVVTTTPRLVPHERSNLGVGGAALICASAGALVGGVGVTIEAATAQGGPAVGKLIGGITLDLLGLTLSGLTLWLFTHDGQPTTELDTHLDEHDEGVVRERVPCSAAQSTLARAPVTGRLSGSPATEITLGETDARGEVTIDLAAALAPRVKQGTEVLGTMEIYLRGALAGTVQLDLLEHARDDQAWLRAAADGCASGATSCDAVAQYLRNFPAGRHVLEANASLEVGEPIQRPRREAAQKAEARRAADDARAQAAAEAARRAAATTCRQICAKGCQGSAGCAESCVAQSCR